MGAIFEMSFKTCWEEKDKPSPWCPDRWHSGGFTWLSTQPVPAKAPGPFLQSCSQSGRHHPVLEPGCLSCPEVALGIRPWQIQLAPLSIPPTCPGPCGLHPYIPHPEYIKNCPQVGCHFAAGWSAVRPLIKLWSKIGCRERSRVLHLLLASR